MLAALALLAPSALAKRIDVGYEQLFQNYGEAWEETCMDVPDMPAFLDGTFIMPAVGLYAVGNRKLTAVLDGYGKFHKFQMHNGRVCVKARMMESAWYNQSVASNTISSSLLFFETEPARDACPADSGSCNNYPNAPNDNAFVHMIELDDGKYVAMTDSPLLLDFSPSTLDVLGLHQWDDDLADDGYEAPLASAHMIKHPTSGLYTGLSMQRPLKDPTLPSYVSIFQVPKGQPKGQPTVREVLTKVPLAVMPYMHSYKVTPDFGVLLLQPFGVNWNTTHAGGTLTSAFKDTSTGKNTQFVVAPLDGGEPRVFDALEVLFDVHIINAYQTDTSIIFDAPLLAANIFATGLKLSLANGTLRNLAPPGYRAKVLRFELHLSGPKNGTVTKTTLNPKKPKGSSVDFPKINMAYEGLPYCYYYAVEWFHASAFVYGSMAIVKQNVCTGETLSWYTESNFPSEPFFIANPGATEEDDGVVVFTVLDGPNDTSKYMIVDAKTMKTITEVPLPGKLGFTTHGQYFANLM